MKQLDILNPTAPQSYSEDGLPLSWRSEKSGRMRRVILDYLELMIQESDLPLLVAYLQHHIHAPCWLEARCLVSPQHRRKITEARVRSLALHTVDDVSAYLRLLQELSIDPL